MASSRGVAHVSRDLLNKLVGIVTDPRLSPQRKLDQGSATLDRMIRDAESPASVSRHLFVGALDDAISTAAELARGGAPRSEIEARVRGKLADALREVPGITIEGGR
jgi:hypothetical protein